MKKCYTFLPFLINKYSNHLQEWPRSPGLHVLQAGRQAEPAADHGTGTPHPQGSHIQGNRNGDALYIPCYVGSELEAIVPQPS